MKKIGRIFGQTKGRFNAVQILTLKLKTMEKTTIEKQLNSLDKFSTKLFYIILVAFFVWLFAQIIINL